MLSLVWWSLGGTLLRLNICFISSTTLSGQPSNSKGSVSRPGLPPLTEGTGDDEVGMAVQTGGDPYVLAD